MGKERTEDTNKLWHIVRWQRLSARPREHWKEEYDPGIDIIVPNMQRHGKNKWMFKHS